MLSVTIPNIRPSQKTPVLPNIRRIVTRPTGARLHRWGGNCGDEDLQKAQTRDEYRRMQEAFRAKQVGRATRLSKRHPLKGFPRSPCWRTECYLALITNQTLFVIILA